ncbi:hypothetical protein [Trinickia acidisoli]|uniref:hypothetical protein n=1 Tax=Trinickia acidisoli TaxID=2767482 RepID=UPI001A8D9707|nr:hypothetical protein [Trinickia acidisoli]
MPVDNISTNPFESAPLETENAHQETTAPVSQEKPSFPSSNPFAELINKEESRTPIQDTTGLRLNANMSKLNAFKQSRGEQLIGQSGRVGDEGVHMAGEANHVMDNKMERMMQMQEDAAERQMTLKMFETSLEFQKDLVGGVARMSQKIQ